MVAMNTQKPKINLAMIEELKSAFEAVNGKRGERRKWVAASAAVYLFLRLPEAERDRVTSLMWQADDDPKVLARILAEIEAADESGFVFETTTPAGGLPRLPVAPVAKPPSSSQAGGRGRRPAKAK